MSTSRELEEAKFAEGLRADARAEHVMIAKHGRDGWLALMQRNDDEYSKEFVLARVSMPSIDGGSSSDE